MLKIPILKKNVSFNEDNLEKIIPTNILESQEQEIKKLISLNNINTLNQCLEFSIKKKIVL